MTRSHEELAALAPAFVIGALDPDEHEAFVRHVAGCERCAAEVRALEGVGDALARSVPGHAPPVGLETRVLAAALAARPAVTETAAPRPRAARGGWFSTFVWDVRFGLAAAALVAAAVTGAYAIDLRSRIAELEDSLARAAALLAATERDLVDVRRAAVQSQSAMTVLAASDLVRIDLAGQPVAPAASARALWSRQRGMVFAFRNLPPPPEGRAYQVWVVTASAPLSAGLLAPDASGDGIAVFMTPADIAPPVAIAVTIEPSGGVPAPTGDRYLIGTPAA